MWTGATQALEQNLTNVAFVRTRIELITRFFAPGEVSEIWITFADPQMKKVNKRLTCTMFMQRYLQILKPKGLVHLKSDSNFLFTYTEEMAKANQLPVLAKTRDLYKDEEFAPVETIEALRNIQTAYEKQWLARGIDIKYIVFEPQPRDPWIEPDVEIELDSYRSYGRDKNSALTTHK
jgi:tRNA (guanine-N7-)-methyltransferase